MKAGIKTVKLRWDFRSIKNSWNHRCTMFENPEGGSMRFLPNFGREGI